ncbi:MAG: RecQ family ATP-dependent DNA helicase [Treponema sp.]|jgi:ATP-dependent DNA helicase RecQ|nr:RecQ family ATP-dependent DNA helicase [Treponema sp.]
MTGVPANPRGTAAGAPLEVLKNQFGYPSFRPGQEEVIEAILAGRDVLAVMPTGAGKSLCYQIPALMLPGMTVVISPLISLMKDQVSALREAGCEAAFLNSSLSAAEYSGTMNRISRGGVKLLYIAPERLRREETARLMERGSAAGGSPLVVVDEAHCVSQWGHDFRTSYLRIADFIQALEPRPAAAAFTATATPQVRSDIERLLDLREPFSITTGFDRPNLYFEVRKPRHKKTALLECLERRRDLSGIVYCATRKGVEEVYELLLRHGFAAARYHAGLDDRERRENQEDFLYDRRTVMVATNAFGMGIDKSNVSFVIHYNMPKNIESYYQEAGRAGRDGSPADCVLLYNGQDVRINEFLITRGDEREAADPALRAHNLELLKRMTFYAAGHECLRRRLLSYFGEKAPAYCGRCSNCLTGFEEIDVTLEARKIISCVYRLKQRGRAFGKGMIVDILRGGKNEKILRFGLDSLSTWGIMAETSARRIGMILDFLIDEGCLSREGGEYPVVALGRAGDVLRGERRLCLKLPREEEPEARDLNLGVASSETGMGPFPGRPGPPAAGARSKETPRDGAFRDDAPWDEALFVKLRELRKELAAKEGVPAYIVFSDTALRDMCRKKPVSLERFSLVNGVGSVKLEKYGRAFTELIKEQARGGREDPGRGEGGVTGVPAP